MTQIVGLLENLHCHDYVVSEGLHVLALFANTFPNFACTMLLLDTK